MTKMLAKKTWITAALLVSISGFAYAQADLDEEINSELERIYAQQNGASANPTTNNRALRGDASQVQVNVNAAPVAANTTESALGTYQGQVAPVSNTPTTAIAAPQAVAPIQSSQLSIQRQAPTYIEASPLQESRADALRRSRQDAEVTTEQRIVEKLEFSRLEDEKRRSEVLFGDKFQQMNASQTQQVIMPVNTVPMHAPVVQEQVVAPMQRAPVEDGDEMDSELIRNEVRASLAEMSQEKPKALRYFSGGVGISEYLNANNVKNNYSVGFGIGSRVSERLLVEGTFTYGSFQIQQRDGVSYCDAIYGCGYFSRLTDMDQYTGSAVAKYQIFNGLFRPVFGGVLSYSYRTFTDSQFAIANNDAQTHSLDLGMVAGADVELSEEFSLGIEFKYMFLNFFNRNSNQFSRGFSRSVYGSDTPIERMNQMTISVMGRATF